MALRVLVQFQQFLVLVSSWVLPFLCLCRGAFGQLLAFGSHSLLDVTTLSSATTCPVLHWVKRASGIPGFRFFCTTVQMMQTAGSQAGMWYKYNGKTWAPCEPPPSV